MIAESIISLIPVCFNYAHSLYIKHQAYNVQSDHLQGRFHVGVEGSRRRSQADLAASVPEVDDDETEPASRLVPGLWVVIGLCTSAVLGIVLVWLIFGNDGIRPWATATGLVLASVLSLLGVRALGETDLNPVSGIGKISQLLFAVLQPGNVVANIIAGGVAEVSYVLSTQVLFECLHSIF
jgi:hypothetical protein